MRIHISRDWLRSLLSMRLTRSLLSQHLVKSICCTGGAMRLNVFEGARCIALLVGLSAIGASSAFAQQGWSFGVGERTCGEAMQQIERGGQVTEAIYREWILGYISGMNTAAMLAMNRDSLVGKGTT